MKIPIDQKKQPSFNVFLGRKPNKYSERTITQQLKTAASKSSRVTPSRLRKTQQIRVHEEIVSRYHRPETENQSGGGSLERTQQIETYKGTDILSDTNSIQNTLMSMNPRNFAARIVYSSKGSQNRGQTANILYRQKLRSNFSYKANLIQSGESFLKKGTF